MSDSLWPPGLEPARLLYPWISQPRILEWVASPSSTGNAGSQLLLSLWTDMQEPVSPHSHTQQHGTSLRHPRSSATGQTAGKEREGAIDTTAQNTLTERYADDLVRNWAFLHESRKIYLHGELRSKRKGQAQRWRFRLDRRSNSDYQSQCQIRVPPEDRCEGTCLCVCWGLTRGVGHLAWSCHIVPAFSTAPQLWYNDSCSRLHLRLTTLSPIPPFPSPSLSWKPLGGCTETALVLCMLQATCSWSS